MTTQSIEAGIKKRLTGNSQYDMAYLCRLIRKYDDTPLGETVRTECEKCLSNMFPENMYEALGRTYVFETAKKSSLRDQARYVRNDMYDRYRRKADVYVSAYMECREVLSTIR